MEPKKEMNMLDESTKIEKCKAEEESLWGSGERLPKK
jgi:hypothetical protein